MDYRILGPLEVLRNGEPLDLGPHKQRALLALLLLHPGRVVATDRILEYLWGEDAPGKEKSLWAYVSRLRTVLEPGRATATPSEVLVTRDHGYMLQIGPLEIDAARFEDAVARGRSLILEDPERASSLLRDAIAMWRGSALQDFTYEEFARADINRLEELRVGATEDAYDADLRIGRAAELIGGLEAFADLHPLRERPVGLLMLALYRAGRSADALRAYERFRRRAGEELGIEPSPELRRREEQILLHDSSLRLSRHTAGMDLVRPDVANPYKGLRAFREEDSADFFGRDRLVADTIRTLADGARLVALVGPSGSGKSSVLRAGVVPALRRGAIAESDTWVVCHMLPGSQPLIELEATLLRSTLDAPGSLYEILSEDETGLLRAALRVLPHDSSRLVLAIDQFEELFTLVDDESARRRFIDHLVTAIDDPHGRVTIIVTLRSDFYSRPLEYPDLADRLSGAVINVPPLAPDELEAAALEPAYRSGVRLEPALLAELVADVIGQPGALPMFQYTLTEMFDRRTGDLLSADVYGALGGVRGAISRRADDLYGDLGSVQQESARQLFLRLVTVTETGAPSRRRLQASEILDLDIDLVAVQEVIESFAAHRLLTLDRDLATGAPTVEVAHEALIEEWGRLRMWIEDHRNDLVRHGELAAAAERWEAAGRDPDYVYAGGRLHDALAWAAGSTMRLTEAERAFLDAGVDKLQVAEAEEDRRRTHEERLERRARRRTAGMVATVAVLVAVLGTVAWVTTRPEGPRIVLIHEPVEEGGGVQRLTLDGWEQAIRDFDFEATQSVPLIDEGESIEGYAEAGYDLIISSLYDFGAEVLDVAPDFPDTHFVVFDGGDTDLDNVTSIDFEREGGAYLMGVAAALTSETGRIGFIGGRQQATTEARRAAYTAGAKSIDPDIQVDSVYLGPYQSENSAYLDVQLAYETAVDMYRSGVDVIHHSAGTAGQSGIPSAAALVEAETGRHVWLIGTEFDEQRAAAPDHADYYLTSMWKRRDRAIQEIVRTFIEGTLEPGVVVLGLDTGGVDYAVEGGLSPTAIRSIDAVKADLISGVIAPSSAVDAPPRWTRESTVTVTLVFDGDACTADHPVVDVVAGDVVRAEIHNESSQPVRLVVASDWDEFAGGLESLTAPGARDAIARRLRVGSYVVQCATADEEFTPVRVSSHFAAACDLDSETSEPVDVVRALDAAINARDMNAVCSLLAEDAVLIDGSGVLRGREQIAVLGTPLDDDLLFQELATGDLEEVEGAVLWKYDYVGLFDTSSHVVSVMVEDGKVTELRYVD